MTAAFTKLNIFYLILMVPKSKPYDDLPTALREKEIEKERVIQKKTDR